MARECIAERLSGGGASRSVLDRKPALALGVLLDEASCLGAAVLDLLKHAKDNARLGGLVLSGRVLPDLGIDQPSEALVATVVGNLATTA